MTMQTETTATEVTAPAAPIVDVNAPPAAAPASAAPAEGAATVDTTTTTAPAADDGSKPQEDQDRNEKGQYKPGAQKRIDELTFRRHQAEREAAHWKQVAESRAPAAAPKPGDFATDAEYTEALLEHRIDSRVNDGLAKTATAQADKFNQEANTAAGEAYNQRVAETIARIPDFVEIVSKADIAISPALQEALRDSEKGPELVYHLAKNPGEAERLNAMNVRQMDREIGRLETTIGAKSAAPSAPAARTTNAPPPVKPGSPASAPANTDPAKMTQAEYESWRKQNGARHTR
jgi:hypothetical protein